MKFAQAPQKVVVLGTGGTIAGLAPQASDHVGYLAAQLGVSDLLARLPALAELLQGHGLLTEQVAQIDSKDMTSAIWTRLLARLVHHLSQADVAAVLITHGTDTLEETAFFLQALLPPTLQSAKPVVLTCAMRPASALMPDGPQNLVDALCVALTPGARGVLVVCAGQVHHALRVQKDHPYRLDAFSSGDAGALAYVEQQALRLLQPWPAVPEGPEPLTVEVLSQLARWPRVELLMSHAGADGAVVDALLQHAPALGPIRGLVVAGTGNGSLHRELEAALRRAVQAGVRVVRASRCSQGRVLAQAGSEFADSGGLSPVKARIALMLELIREDLRWPARRA